MKEHSSQGRGIFAALLMMVLAVAGVSAADVGIFLAAKGQRWMQTNAGSAVPASASNFVFNASVEPGGPETLTNGWFTPPGGTPISFLGGPPGSDGEFEREFTNSTALDAAFPNGGYVFVTEGVNDGARTNTLSLSGGAYPATPFFNAFSAAQSIDPAADFLLTWNAISGVTENDYISLEIMDCQGEHIFSTPAPIKPGALNALSTNYVIRARTLRPGQEYKLKFLVAHFSTFDTNSYPGAIGIAGYFKEVFMLMKTTGTPVGCPPGQFSMTFNFPQGQFDGTNGVLPFPTALEQYTVQYSVRGDMNPPETIAFTGPGGSGLNNTNSVNRQFFDDFARYSSPQVNVPPFPPGGVYNVNYGANVRSFNLLDPNAGNEQVVLLPRLVIDGETNIVEVRWSFADTNGNTISPPSFIVNISLYLQGQVGSLYSSDWFGEPLPGTAVAHTLFQSLPLELMQSLQLSFRDSAGNTFVSGFGGGGAPPGIEIVTQTLPPGNVGQNYGFELTAQGGQPPYVWQLSAGTLPPGLFLDSETGGIYGIPSESTVREFVVAAVDSHAQSATRSFVIAVGEGGNPPSSDKSFYAALKGRRWAQTNSGPVVPSAEGPYFFNAFVESQMASSAQIVPPGGTPLLLQSERQGSAEYKQEFNSQGALDAAFPTGDYAVVTTSERAGSETNLLLVTGEIYPAAPQVSNFSAAQAIDPAVDFILSWNPIANGTEADFLQLELRDCNGDDVVSTPRPGEPGALNGTSSNFTFRARSLRPGSVYKAQIFIARFTDIQTNSPNAMGLAGYVSVTELELRTQGTNPGCPQGRLSFVFNFPPGSIDGTNGVIAFPTGLEHYSAHYEFRNEGNPPPGVTFTGPVGSGLSNTTNGEAQFFGGGGFYSSTPVAVPPFPPGGNYVVSFNGNNRTFPMLASVAAGQQVVLVPTLSVDDMGMLTEIQWRPAYTNGTTASSPTFIESVSLTLHSSNGPIYQVGVDGEPLPGGATSHALNNPVPWDQVTAVQLLFHDAAGDTYISTFNRGSIEPPSDLHIVTEALPPGAAGTNYAVTVTAAGGTFPYFWEKTTGNLPPGLTLNEATGELSGVPNAGGSFNFTVRVTDMMEDFHERVFTLNIRGGSLIPPIDGYGIIKGQMFVQTGASPPVLGTNEPFRFEAFVDARLQGTVTNAVVRSPKGTNYPLLAESFSAFSLAANVGAGGGDYEFEGESFRHIQRFATKGAFDNVFGSGTYLFPIGVTGYSNRTAQLNLPGDAYPVAAQIANWDAVQAVDSFNDFTLTWNPLNGATTNDIVQIEIEDEEGTVYRSPEPGDIGALNGRSTSHVIPGGTLASGQQYKGMILVGRIAAVNTNSYPGAKGFGGYAKATYFPISTVTPPPPQGQIQFGATTFSVSETGLVATFTVTRTGGTEGDVSVEFTTSDGTALGDLDYEATAGPIEMLDGEAEVTFSFNVYDDDIVETNETVHLTLLNPAGGATLGALTNATVVINDDDVRGAAGLLQFSSSSVVVGESSSTVTLTVTRTDGKAGEVTVDYSTDDGSADGELDYAPTSGTLTFPANVTSQTFTIGIVNDDLDETNETFVVRLENPEGGALLGARNVATVSITDNDSGGEIRLGSAAYRFSETNEEAVITITRTGGVAAEVSVDVILSDVTATGGEDYTATAETVNFEAGQATATFVLLIDNDSLPEGDETLTVDLANPTGGATLGRGTNAVVTIVDDEESLQFSAEAYTVDESAPAVMLTVLRSGPATGTVTVDYQTAGGSAESDEDFFGTNGTITFGPGVKSRTLSVRINRDQAVEDDEDFTVELGNPVGALLGTVTEAVVNIVDDDEGGVISFKTAEFTVKENAPVAVVTVNRTGGNASGVSFTFATSDGSAEEGDDYTGVEQTFEFPAGATSMKIEIPILNDAFDETNETVQLTLSEPAGGATLGELSEATLTIVDNDTAGVIAFSAPTYSVTETGAVALITLTRSGGAAAGVSVDLVTAGGTATPDEDYVAITNTFLFESNQTRITVEIEINDDELPDGNETVMLALSNPTGGGRLGARTNAVLNIIDDERSVQFTNVSFTVVEGVRNAIVTVKRSGPLKGAMTVQYATSDGTATAGSDYTARSGTLSFSSGSSAKTITIPITNDTADESDETFTITLSAPSEGVVLGENDTVTVTIQDNDPASLRPVRPARP